MPAPVRSGKTETGPDKSMALIGMTIAPTQAGRVEAHGAHPPEGNSPMSVVKIASDGGKVMKDGWSHASVRAELTNATQDQVDRVRHLVERIVEVIERGKDPA